MSDHAVYVPGVIPLSDAPENFRTPNGARTGTKCPECGRRFYPTEEWAYRSKNKLCCSYGCMRQRERRAAHPRNFLPPETAEAILRLYQETPEISYAEISRQLGVSPHTAKRYIQDEMQRRREDAP